MHGDFGDTSMARKVDLVWIFSGNLSSEINQARNPLDRMAVWWSEGAVGWAIMNNRGAHDRTLIHAYPHIQVSGHTWSQFLMGYWSDLSRHSAFLALPSFLFTGLYPYSFKLHSLL